MENENKNANKSLGSLTKQMFFSTRSSTNSPVQTTRPPVPVLTYSDTVCEILLCITTVSLIESRVMAILLCLTGVSILAFILWIWSVFILDILTIAFLAFISMKSRNQSPLLHSALLLLAFFIMTMEIIFSCANIKYMDFSRNQIDWRIAFDVNMSGSNKDMFAAQFSYAFFLFGTQIAVGFSLWLIRQRVHLSQILSNLSNTHYGQKLTKFHESRLAFSPFVPWKWYLVITLYLACVAIFRPSDPWNEATSSVFIDFFTASRAALRTNTLDTDLYFNSDFELSFLASKIQQPRSDFSRALTHLDAPIKHVVMVLMESIRSDVMPLQQRFFEATGTKPTEEVDLNISPFLNDLIPKSVHTNATATITYTLKSILSNHCGIYPLDVNFNKEYRYSKLYTKCLPELLAETFPDSAKSAFSTSAGGDFDQQADLISMLQFNSTITYEEIRKKYPFVPKLGWFGSSDDSSLPHISEWVETSLNETPDRRLFLSTLTTGTHFPWDPPFGYESQPYTNDGELNKYLNSIRVTDTFLENIVKIFKTYNIYNETLFLFLGDHGHGLKDYGSNHFGAFGNPYQHGFDIPLIIFNEQLGAISYQQSRATSLDILPTIIDALVSSSSASPSASNFLTDLTDSSKLQSILDSYDGKSLFRPSRNDELFPLTMSRRAAYRTNPYEVHFLESKPLESLLYSKHFTFHMDNPGRSHYNVLHFNRKLIHNINDNRFELYHLGFDPHEQHDLLKIDMNTDLSWLNVESHNIERLNHDLQDWTWATSFIDGLNYLSKRSRRGHRPHPDPDGHRAHPPPKHQDRRSKPKLDRNNQSADSYIDTLPDGKLDLDVMYDWAEDAFWVASGAKNLIRMRYELRSKDINFDDLRPDEFGDNSLLSTLEDE